MGEADPRTLIPHPKNFRRHPAAQLEAIDELLSSIGWVQGLVVNEKTGYMIDGHARRERAIQRGEPAVPVTFVALEPAEEELLLATFDQVARMATADRDRAAALLEALTTQGAAIGALLLDVARFAGLDALRPGRTDPDSVPGRPDHVDVDRGDVYVVGPHRFMCGDSTIEGDVLRLFDGARPVITIADAPYGTLYDPTWRPGHRRSGAVPNDDRADWRAAWLLSPSDVLYAWHSGLHSDVVAVGIAAAGFDIRAQIIWVKPGPVLSRGAYHWQHEPLYYAVRRGASAHWRGDRRQTTVWEIPTVHATRGTADDAVTIHGAQKPVECIARALRNHAGDLYDPFAGVGTGAIAAHGLGRRSFSMELDPTYLQIAIERVSAFVGEPAVRA